MEDENALDKVIAKHEIHRRVGDHFEVVKPGTEFVPQSEDELNEFKKAGAVYDSVKERDAYERAAEGVIRRGTPGVERRALPAHALRVEQAARVGIVLNETQAQSPVPLAPEAPVISGTANPNDQTQDAIESRRAARAAKIAAEQARTNG